MPQDRMAVCTRHSEHGRKPRVFGRQYSPAQRPKDKCQQISTEGREAAFHVATLFWHHQLSLRSVASIVAPWWSAAPANNGQQASRQVQSPAEISIDASVELFAS